MDYVLFIEYRLNPKMRSQYLLEVKHSLDASSVQWLESQEQADLFVETWRTNAQEAAGLGETRTEQLQPFLLSGTAVKRWLFKNVQGSERP